MNGKFNENSENGDEKFSAKVSGNQERDLSETNADIDTHSVIEHDLPLSCESNAQAEDSSYPSAINEHKNFCRYALPWMAIEVEDELKNEKGPLYELDHVKSNVKHFCKSDVQNLEKIPYELNSFSGKPIGGPCLQQIEKLALKLSDEKSDSHGRTMVLNSLNEEEKVKFRILEEAVAKNGWKYQAIDIAQFLIVSHLKIKRSLTRIRKWREVMRTYGGDQVSVFSAFEYIKAHPEYTSIGGYDRDGRRIYVIHFGSMPANEILDEYSTFCKCFNLLWDATTINVPEIRAGLCFICDLKNFGTSNWSIKLLLRLLQFINEKYPIRLRRIYLLDQSTFFNVIAKILMTVLPKWIKSRIKLMKSEGLRNIIPQHSLPPRVGGTYKDAADLAAWVAKRLENRHGISWSRYYEKVTNDVR